MDQNNSFINNLIQQVRNERQEIFDQSSDETIDSGEEILETIDSYISEMQLIVTAMETNLTNVITKKQQSIHKLQEHINNSQMQHQDQVMDYFMKEIMSLEQQHFHPMPNIKEFTILRMKLVKEFNHIEKEGVEISAHIISQKNKQVQDLVQTYESLALRLQMIYGSRLAHIHEAPCILFADLKARDRESNRKEYCEIVKYKRARQFQLENQFLYFQISQSINVPKIRKRAAIQYINTLRQLQIMISYTNCMKVYLLRLEEFMANKGEKGEESKESKQKIKRIWYFLEIYEKMGHKNAVSLEKCYESIAEQNSDRMNLIVKKTGLNDYYKFKMQEWSKQQRAYRNALEFYGNK